MTQNPNSDSEAVVTAVGQPIRPAVHVLQKADPATHDASVASQTTQTSEPRDGEFGSQDSSERRSDIDDTWDRDSRAGSTGRSFAQKSSQSSLTANDSSFSTYSSSPPRALSGPLEIEGDLCSDVVAPLGSQKPYVVDNNLRIARDSFKGTGTQGIVCESVSRTSESAISDGGDQLFKRHIDSHTSAGFRPGSSTLSDYADDNQESVEKDLGDRLHDALEQSYDSRQKHFIPKATLNNLVNTASVTRELESSLSYLPAKKIKRLARTVCGQTWVTSATNKPKIKSFKAIFALLVILEKSMLIESFIEEDDVSDLDLPLVFSEDNPKELRCRDAQARPLSKRLSCFAKWKLFAMERFEEEQWRLLAPFFSHGEANSVPHYLLKTQHILPFLPGEGQEVERAGQSRVFMVRIHKEHHDFPHPWLCERGFAIKELCKDDRGEYKREVEILKKFTGEKAHPHVVTLLATYEQFDKYHLMFYRADGNLFDYWKEVNPKPDFSYENVLFLAEQCSGMASGLLRLHRHSTNLKVSSIPSHVEEEELKRRFSDQASTPGQESDALRPAQLVNRPVGESGETVEQFGRHGDLKPENILWYADRVTGGKGTLKITDFGASEINSRWTRTKRRSQIPNTPTYSPPELYMHHQVIRQSYDIWSLACVYMEFISWLLGGRDLLMEFARKRLVYDIFQRHMTDIFFELVRFAGTDETGARVKPAVTKFFDTLHGHPNCTDYIHDLLILIQDDMLVVEPPDLRMSRRFYCKEVSNFLTDKYEMCCKDRDYATCKKPWRKDMPNSKNPLGDAVKVSMAEDAERVVAESRDKLPLY